MILVTGASGLNGFKIVSKLAQDGIPVRALIRKPGHAGLAALRNVEVVVGDMLKPETLLPALKGIDRAMLISSSAPDMVEVQCRFIDAAKQAGVGEIVKLSGILPELDSPFRFARMHGEIEKYLEGSGLAFTHLRAGEFMHSYFRQLPLITTQGRILLSMEDAKIACIDVDDIAEIAGYVLTSSGHEGQAYRLTGPEALSMAEVAQKLSEVTGQTITYFNVAPEKSKQARLDAGMPPYLAEALDELFAERRKGKESTVYDDADKLMKRRPLSTFSDFAKRYAAVFRGEEPAPKA